MAYTFGGLGTENIQYTGLLAGVADNSATLVTCWVYPTTLTAGRNYWGMGTPPGISAFVSTTTSEVDVNANNATTDGLWRTSGLGMTTNQWQFLAVFYATENTTVPGQVRVWRGTETEPPAAGTVTNPTVRSGNYTGSTTRTIGNDGSPSSFAFQGDLAGYTCAVTNAVGVNNGLVVATSGTLSAAEETLLYQRWVYPLWAGTAEFWRMRPTTFGGSFTLEYAPLDLSGVAYCYSNPISTVGVQTLTVGGATYTKNSPSRLPRNDWVRNFARG